jgi:hypothetical protein
VSVSSGVARHADARRRGTYVPCVAALLCAIMQAATKVLDKTVTILTLSPYSDA